MRLACEMVPHLASFKNLFYRSAEPGPYRNFSPRGYASENYLDSEVKRVRKLAERIVTGMCTDETLNRLNEVHRVDASSKQIQMVIQPIAATLGFKNESATLFAKSSVASLRPDYYLKMGRTGVLLEVERGSVLSGNRDLLDFWKCHICERANHLILVVPFERRSRFGRVTFPFRDVCRRLSVFFEPPNCVNVASLHVIGY